MKITIFQFTSISAIAFIGMGTIGKLAATYAVKGCNLIKPGMVSPIHQNRFEVIAFTITGIWGLAEAYVFRKRLSDFHASYLNFKKENEILQDLKNKLYVNRSSAIPAEK